MRILKAFFAVVLSASFLSGCGGGDALDSLTGGSSGGGGGGTTSDLYAAYNKIEGGMNYEQVKNIVGYDNNNGKSEYSDRTNYSWSSGVGTSNPMILGVDIDAAGVSYKMIVGHAGSGTGSSSKSYR